jgi:probable addiction module antidote protein
MAIKTYPFDPAKYLTTAQDCAYFLTDAFETNDPAQIADALGVVARARGMSEIAKKTGLRREGLYKMLSVQGNPEMATVCRILQAIGVRLVAEPAKAKRKTTGKSAATRKAA